MAVTSIKEGLCFLEEKEVSGALRFIIVTNKRKTLKGLEIYTVF
jgi:hypothetical protein